MNNLGRCEKMPIGVKDFPYTVASVDRAVELLFLLENASRDMGITELSKLLNVQKSTVHNLVQTLLARDFVRQTDSGRFTLGFRLMRLGEAAAKQIDIRRLAHPALNQLAADANEYVLLAVLNRGAVTIIDSVAPQRSTFIVPRIDFGQTAHCTALGKVFLAFTPEPDRQLLLTRPLTQYTTFTLVTDQALNAEIEKIQNQGYTISCNETIEGVTCLGAPVFNAHGRLVAAVSISSATARLTPDRYQCMAAILKEKAAAISHELGF
jgi:DNA-binding IclR family transcriptional regulator